MRLEDVPWYCGTGVREWVGGQRSEVRGQRSEGIKNYVKNN